MEKISLASFEFDISLLEKSLEELQGALFDVQKEQKRHAEQSKRLGKQYDDLNKKQIELKKRKQEESEEYRNVVAEMRKVEQQQKGLFISQKDLQIQSSKVRTEYNKTVKLYSNLMNKTGELTSANDLLDEALNREVKTIGEARASNSELLKIRNNLNLEAEGSADILEVLNKRLDENNRFIKENVSAYEQQKINIGNYKNDIKDAAGELDIFNGGISGFITKANEAGGAGKLVSSSISQMTTATIGLTKAMMAFLFTPIGAVLAAIAGAFLLVKNALNRSEEATDKLSTVFGAFSGVLKFLLALLEPIGKVLVDGIVLGFEMAGKMAEKFIGVMDKVGKTTAKVLNAIGFKKAGEAVQDYTEYQTKASMAMLNAAKSGAKLAQAEADLTTSQRALKLATSAMAKEISNLKNIRDDENVSIKERIKANNDLQKMLEIQQQQEKRNAEESLRIIRAKIQMHGKTTELIDAEIEALNKLNDIEEKINSQKRETIRANNRLQKQAHDSNMQRIDAEIQKNRESLELWIAQQGDKARTLEEQLKLEQEVSNRSLKILDEELKAKKISQEKYDLEVLKLKQNTAKIQAEIAVQVAKDELNEFVKSNKDRLEHSNRFTADLLEQEISREQEIQRRKIEIEKERYDSGLINKREYDEAVLLAQEEFFNNENKLRETYRQQQIEDETTARILAHEALMLELEENLASEFEKRREQQEFEYNDQLIRLEQQRIDGLISEENYQQALSNIQKAHSEVNKKINEEELNAKLNMYQSVFGSISGLVSENTAMGKAAGIATATINAYQGVSEVWKSPSVLPEPANTILKGLQSGITIASGLSAVKKIASTEVPKEKGAKKQGKIKGYTTGGVITDGFGIRRNNGDNVLITARTGEAILNETQQALIGHDLLKMAGVPGFNKGGVVGRVALKKQDPIFDMDALKIAIVESTREGTQQGSMEGTQQGSYAGTFSGTERGIANTGNSGLNVVR